MINKPLPFIALSVTAIAVSIATLACSLTTRLADVAPTPTPTATATPMSAELIAYAGSDGNIYTIDRLGANQKAVTSDASLDFQTPETGRIYEYPTWAPDGVHLAFVELSAGKSPSVHASLISANVASGEKVETFSSDVYQPFYLYWSPDSRKISFLSNGDAGVGLLLHLAAADGSGSQIAGMGQPYYWDWSPKDNEIFIHTGGAAAENPDARLAYITMDDPFPSQEIDLQPAAFQAPAWSPDGETIALAINIEAGEVLILRDRQSGNQQTITDIEGAVAFAWSPDGKDLAYTVYSSSNPGGMDKELYVVQPAHPEEKKLLATGALVSFFWSPDSQQIAVITPPLSDPGANSIGALKSGALGSGSLENSALGSGALGSGALENSALKSGVQMVSSLESNSLESIVQQHPAIILGLQVIDVASGDTKHLTSFSPTEAFLSLLPFYDQYQRSMTLWSRDSRELVIAALDSQQRAGIYVIDTAGGGGKRIADGEQAVWSP